MLKGTPTLQDIVILPCNTEAEWIHQRGIWNYYAEEARGYIEAFDKYPKRHHDVQLTDIKSNLEAYERLLKQDKIINAQYWI